MKLSTEVNINKPEKSFTYDSVITGIGSCFAQYVMEELRGLGFDCIHNPNGIVYNAASIASSLKHIINNIDYDESNFIFYNDLWHSWEHHGSFSNADINQLKKEIANSSHSFKKQLDKSDIFLMTPSSSVVYRLNSNDQIVANCHKYPEKYFSKEILSVKENYNALKESVELIKKTNPNCKIIITLSPVRHYPGDLVLNGQSKANLLSAIHQCIETFQDVEYTQEYPYFGNHSVPSNAKQKKAPPSGTKIGSCPVYFPSYEILLDELRDYRFFNEDMLHPTKLARKIIFSKFTSTYFTPETQKNLTEKEKQIKQSQHNNLR